jgi:hypothetical protein
MADTRTIELDCDVLFGTWPPRAQVPMDIESVAAVLAGGEVNGALAASARGAWFDDIAGNDETIDQVSGRPGWLPAGTVDLRDATHAADELDRLAAAGVRAVRLFANQACEPTFPGYQHIVREAVSRDFVLLVEGDVRVVWSAFAGRGARVVFLDTHSYHLADFLIAARDEPHFVTSTRLLNAPDSIERVVGDLGADHIAFGSRTPLHALSSTTIRLRNARISAADWSAVAGGTLRALLEGAGR